MGLQHETIVDRTVLVRSLKSGKILHKVTWNGEKFVEEKWAA
jgi:hypothetical protein